MTWSAWINAAANLPDDGIIAAKSDATSGWQLKTSRDTGSYTFGSAVTASGGSRVQRYSTTVRSLNTWYYVAGVYNATAQTLDIYVNGVLNDGIMVGTPPGSQVNASVNANIGRRTGGLYFNGVIDEVRIYNRALTQSEIQADMNTPPGGCRYRYAAAYSPQYPNVNSGKHEPAQSQLGGLDGRHRGDRLSDRALPRCWMHELRANCHHLYDQLQRRGSVGRRQL